MLILQEGAKITFTAATLYGPLLLISFLYLPTLIYITFLGVRFYGWRKWLVETLNDPVYFVFPFLTSMSFYGEPGATSEDGLPCSIILNNMNTAESNPLPSTSKQLETNSKEDTELDIFKHESDGEDECDDDDDDDGGNDDDNHVDDDDEEEEADSDDEMIKRRIAGVQSNRQLQRIKWQI